MSLSGLLNRFTDAQSDVVAHDDMVAAVNGRSHTLVDVREIPEFRTGSIPGAINVPLSAFDPKRIPAGKPVIVFCATGGRSGIAQQMLKSHGVAEVYNYRPGVSGWRMQGQKLV